MMLTGPTWSKKIREEVGKAVIGQDAIIERLLVALLANGHVLLEGMPGLAKTRGMDRPKPMALKPPNTLPPSLRTFF